MLWGVNVVRNNLKIFIPYSIQKFHEKDLCFSSNQRCGHGIQQWHENTGILSFGFQDSANIANIEPICFNSVSIHIWCRGHNQAANKHLWPIISHMQNRRIDELMLFSPRQPANILYFNIAATFLLICGTLTTVRQ